MITLLLRSTMTIELAEKMLAPWTIYFTANTATKTANIL